MYHLKFVQRNLFCISLEIETKLNEKNDVDEKEIIQVINDMEISFTLEQSTHN